MYLVESATCPRAQPTRPDQAAAGRLTGPDGYRDFGGLGEKALFSAV
jgi:hypothetical protein